MSVIRVVAATLMVVGCGAPKAPGGSSVAADSVQRLQVPNSRQGAGAAGTGIITTTPGSPAYATAESAKRAATADSAKRAAGDTRKEPPLRDSAFGPKFTVDSTGKVTPIKKKP